MYQYLYIKNGGSGSYAAYVEQVTRNNKWNYLELVSRYAATFGGDAVRVLLFEDLQRDPQGFVCDFLDFAGLPALWGAGHGGTHRNVRPTIAEARLGRWANRFLADDSRLARALPAAGRSRLAGARGTALRAFRGLGAFSERVMRLDARAFESDAACRARIREHYAEGNRTLATRLKLDLSGYPH